MEAYNSYGFLGDFSATYEFNQERTYASLLIKNAGFQIKTYAHESEPMPFEMILGVSSRLNMRHLGGQYHGHILRSGIYLILILLNLMLIH